MSHERRKERKERVRERKEGLISKARESEGIERVTHTRRMKEGEGEG